MSIDHLMFLYDPLCGWCYGSMPAVHSLADIDNCIVEPLPSGLFAGDPDKRIDAEFARHIEQADARIAAMSGQRFTDLYRRKVLGDPDMPFDSGPATEALTAVSRWNVRRELDALHAIQRERFIAGRDITDRDVIARALAAALGDDEATWKKRITDPQLTSLTKARMQRARQVMQAVGVQGVPALIWPSKAGVRLLPGHWLFNDKPLPQLIATLSN